MAGRPLPPLTEVPGLYDRRFFQYHSGSLQSQHKVRYLQTPRPTACGIRRSPTTSQMAEVSL